MGAVTLRGDLGDAGCPARVPGGRGRQGRARRGRGRGGRGRGERSALCREIIPMPCARKVLSSNKMSFKTVYMARLLSQKRQQREIHSSTCMRAASMIDGSHPTVPLLIYY